MADPYISQSETLIYGPYAREQMHDVCMGLVPALDPMVLFAIGRQESADAAMQAVLDRQPIPLAPLATSPAPADARDFITRFVSHLNSLKGRPVDPRVLFHGENPSTVGRQRLVKLTGAMQSLSSEIAKHKSQIRDGQTWLDECNEVLERLKGIERQKRSARVERASLTPEVSAAREAWLTIYNANKSLIRGLLAHAGKSELLPLIFDDLAEVHRAPGVSDDETPAEPPSSEEIAKAEAVLAAVAEAEEAPTVDTLAAETPAA
ncbi:MAG TPA: hypothetical protein VH877_12510 [Polyangia bacterium]|nr:hypothetical protein [Polyangia bacterium]